MGARHNQVWQSAIVSPLNSDYWWEEQGFDGNKQVKGRKRHIVVDVLGLVLGCYVTAANVADVKAAPAVLVWVLQIDVCTDGSSLG